MTKLAAYFQSSFLSLFIGVIPVPVNGPKAPYVVGYFLAAGISVWLGFYLRKSPKWWLGCVFLILAPFTGVAISVIYSDGF
jgi:hypothetical protein